MQQLRPSPFVRILMTGKEPISTVRPGEPLKVVVPVADSIVIR
jgi:hypothetical protein